MMKGLMGRCLKHEVTLERVRSKAEQTKDELNQLRSWKTKMEKKFDLSKKVRKELKQSTEDAKKIQDLKDGLCQAKKAAVREYRDSNALLSELGDFKGSTTPSVKLRRPTLIWTFQTSKWRTKLKHPSCPSLQTILMTFLPKLMT